MTENKIPTSQMMMAILVWVQYVHVKQLVDILVQFSAFSYLVTLLHPDSRTIK